jgi:hypothetical protein
MLADLALALVRKMSVAAGPKGRASAHDRRTESLSHPGARVRQLDGEKGELVGGKTV